MVEILDTKGGGWKVVGAAVLDWLAARGLVTAIRADRATLERLLGVRPLPARVTLGASTVAVVVWR